MSALAGGYLGRPIAACDLGKAGVANHKVYALRALSGSGSMARPGQTKRGLSPTRRDHGGREPPTRPVAAPFPGHQGGLTGARLPHSHRYYQRADWRSREPTNYHAAKLTTLLGQRALRGSLDDQ
jgi:hypothetical protein